MIRFITAKVGGIRFVRIGRLAISICIVRKGRQPPHRAPSGRVPVPCTITLERGGGYTVTEIRTCDS